METLIVKEILNKTLNRKRRKAIKQMFFCAKMKYRYGVKMINYESDRKIFACVIKQCRADAIYTKLIFRALKMFSKDDKLKTKFNDNVNGYSENGKPYFLASFRLSKYNKDDKYQKEWDSHR